LTFLYALSTVLILPSCREEKDESDFDKKRREPIIQRNNRQPSCPDIVMILPLEQSCWDFLSFFKGTVSRIWESSKLPPAPSLCLTLCVSLADRGVL